MLAMEYVHYNRFAPIGFLLHLDGVLEKMEEAQAEDVGGHSRLSVFPGFVDRYGEFIARSAYPFRTYPTYSSRRWGKDTLIIRQETRKGWLLQVNTR